MDEAVRLGLSHTKGGRQRLLNRVHLDLEENKQQLLGRTGQELGGCATALFSRTRLASPVQFFEVFCKNKLEVDKKGLELSKREGGQRQQLHKVSEDAIEHA